MHSVLVCSHTGRGSGFGRIAMGIAEALSAIYKVHVLGLGPGQENDSWLGHSHNELDPTRTTGLSELATQLQPGAIVLVGQGQLLAWQVTRLRRDGFAGTIIPYVPVEGPVHDAIPLAELQASTTIVVYTATGAAELNTALEKVHGSRQAIPPIAVIPHAIEKPVFPVPAGVEEVRAKLFPSFAHRAEGVWLLNANRNDYRKRAELTLEAFALVAEALPEATLVMHCDPVRRGKDLRAVRDGLGLGDKVIFTHDVYPDYLTDHQLTQLYACCDIGINTALAEGWGLIAFEHALCGAAQILPAHAGLQEIWGIAPVWIPVSGRRPIDDVFFGEVPGIEVLSVAIRGLVADEHVRQQVAEACAWRARETCFSWEQVGNLWIELVDASIRRRKSLPSFSCIC